jgi:hypothetical protein
MIEDAAQIAMFVDHDREEAMRRFRASCRAIDLMVDRLVDRVMAPDPERHNADEPGE